MKLFSFARLARATNSVVFSVGILVILGYIFNVQVLMSMNPQLTAMNPATAICLVLCSTWVWLYLQTPSTLFLKILAKSIPVILFMAGAEKLLEYAGLSHVYYDRWFFKTILNGRKQYWHTAPCNAAA